MAKPNIGGSGGTWGEELNAFLAVSMDDDGTIKDGAVTKTNAAPTDDKGIANKKYVDDLVDAVNVFPVKAWAVFTGSSADPITKAAGDGIAGTIQKNGTGDYTVTFSVPFSSGAVYGGYGSCQRAGDNANRIVPVTYNADTFRFYTISAAGNPIDCDQVFISVIGA